MQIHLAAKLGITLLMFASGCVAPKEPEAADAAMVGRGVAQELTGTYRGVLPCADCEGIETVLTLARDGTFTSTSRYLGRSASVVRDQGTFSRDDGGAAISLFGRERARYRVDGDKLVRLTLAGAPISGSLAAHYVLTKAPDEIAGRDWKLTELLGSPVKSLKQPVILTFDAQGHRVSGFSGCNRLSGTYVLDAAASRISFSELVMTQRACSEGMDVESGLSEVLRDADGYAMKGGQLELYRSGGRLLARFEDASALE